MVGVDADMHTPLLEREPAERAMRGLVDQASAGRGGALFFVGEAGLGKTALLRHLPAYAESCVVAHGEGHPPAGMVGAGKRRLRDTAVALLQRRDAPALLVLDDLHAADPDSLSVVESLVRLCRDTAVGIVAALRPWPPQARDLALRLALSESASIRRLRPLSEPAAAHLLEQRAQTALPEATVRDAWHATGGNPLLLTTVADALAAGHNHGESSTPTAATLRRGLLLARFADFDRTVLAAGRAAAVLGSSFLPAVVVEMAGLDCVQADCALETMSRSGLLETENGNQARFTYPLVREALYDDIPGPLRTVLHARAFACLHRRGMDAAASAHAVPGGMFGDQEAIAVLRRAGERALAGGAAHEAASALSDAVHLSCDSASADLVAVAATARSEVSGTSGHDLTPAQDRVARLAARGMTNNQIAAELVVSVNTVESHLKMAFSRLGVRRRAELIHHLDTPGRGQKVHFTGFRDANGAPPPLASPA